MVERVDVHIAGEPEQLLADRALYWPARRRLLIADLHLGKGDTFRAAGISVPSGGTLHDLARLDRLLHATDARALWILGDFLHARHHAQVDAAWLAFRARHAGIDVTVVSGNHDRALDAGRLGIELIAGACSEGPLVLRHAPPHAGGSSAAHVVCGHLHPVARLPVVGRVPVFWLSAAQTVLPAFSAFTGGQPLARNPGERLFACNGEAIVAL